jgi:GNAT superfamily N-acetyltransferase
MAGSQIWGGTIRRLWLSEGDKFRDHLLRLDRETRRLRFGMAVNDDFIAEYCSHTGDMKGLVYGYFADGEMHAAAEMRLLGDGWPADAEGAFSVEPAHQNQGIGTELLGRIIRAARNRGVSRLYMNCLAENRKMQRICRKYDAELQFDHGEVVGRVLPALPTYISLWQEALDDSSSLMLTAMDMRERASAFRQ